jgi:UPF0716 protein FxsA
MLLLVPPIRAVAGPGLTAIALRGLQRRVPLIADTTAFTAEPRRSYSGDGRDYIDGEVIDVRDVSDAPDVEPPALRNDPIGDESPGRTASSAG